MCIDMKECGKLTGLQVLWLYRTVGVIKLLLLLFIASVVLKFYICVICKHVVDWLPVPLV